MTTSSRKNAPAFQQTWDETDAAFLDPTSLPIAKAPRAWDRKQEIKTVGNRKKKEIWRRYTTRSRTANATSNEDSDEDIQARPVKRLQRMSPKAIEKTATSRFGRTRAFKVTRWDRRKSVLPRKKVAGTELECDPGEPANDEDAEEQDTTITDSGNASFSEINVDDMEAKSQELALLSENEDRRATFAFLFQENADMPAEDTVDGTSASALETASAYLDHNDYDATITSLSQSPTKTLVDEVRSSEHVIYPKLPPSTGSEDETDTATEQDQHIEAAVEEHAEQPSTSAQSASVIGPHERELLSLADHGTLYPSLRGNTDLEETTESIEGGEESEHGATSPLHEAEDESDDIEIDKQDGSPDEEFTEASLQLDLQRELQTDSSVHVTEESTSSINKNMVLGSDTAEDPEDLIQEEPSTILPPAVEDAMDDITLGLTLGPAMPSSREPTPRKLRSPSPPPRTESGPEDVTMTFAFDDDTALLKNFLSRAAASKAKSENIARRESLQNRRDSDVIRHALASPRKALEDKDPNSPSKYDIEAAPLSPSRTEAGAEAEEADDSKGERTSRRSSRARKSRLPAPSSVPTGPPKIAVKRDGGDPVVLKKTDAQELSLVTRANTRKNKQGAIAVNVRLLKLSGEARTTEDNTTDSADSVVQVPGKKYVRWDSQLAYFQEDTEAIANALVDAESLATPDELSMAPPAAKPTRVKVPKIDKNTTPKVRKVKNLGSANGTPGKGLLAPVSLLPDTVLDVKEEAKERQRLPKPRMSRVKKMAVAGTDTAPGAAPVESKLPVLEIAPVGIDATRTATKERKSRLVTPKRVKLPQLSAVIVGDGKENQKSGIAAATPKKGIPVPSVVVPSTMELATGLPRRRGRKL